MHPIEQIKSAARRGLAAIGRGPVSALALALFRRPARRQEDLAVHMLVSSRTLHAGLLAAAGLELHTGRRWEFCFHDDGSVTAPQQEAIAATFADARFIPRAAADATAARDLAGHPRCLANRQTHNLFLKFFDTLTHLSTLRFLVLDSDVIFFRRPQEILDWADSGSRVCRYNEDTREKFCSPRADIEAALPVTLPPRFNSGLVLMPRDAMNPGLAGRLLEALEGKAHAPQFFEQTLYALMASCNPDGARPLPRTYNISWGYLRGRGSVCRHYVGKFKDDLLYIEGAPMLLLAVIRRRLTGGWR
jgi:hypothetical protein